MTIEEARKIKARPLFWNYSDLGDNVQKAFEKLIPKHAGYITEEGEKEFVKHIIEFLQLEEVDFVTKICTIRQVCQLPLQCYDVIYCDE